MLSIAARSARQAGATLIEVLVTVAVTSIGLLGTAGLMAVSANINQDAYLHTQAGFIAQTLIESMHINRAGVAAGAYVGNLAEPAVSVASCRVQACTPRQRAAYDRARFAHDLDATLPNATAQLACSAGDRPAVADAPADVLCRLHIGWSPAAPSPAASEAARTLAWVFQP